MSDIIQERLNNAAREWDFATVVDGKVIKMEIPKEIPVDKKDDKPIPTSELISLLTKETSQPTVNIDGTEASFNGLREFNSWYLTNRETFSEEQRAALNTLVGIEDLVAKGCKCNESERNTQAHQYYEDFFLINRERGNDLLETIKKIGKFSKINFSNPFSSGSQPFLTI